MQLMLNRVLWNVSSAPDSGREYQLVAKYIGMKTVSQSLTVSGKDLAVGTIRMQEADNRLGEVAVKKRE